jgi:hypothetical protein
MNRVPYLIRRHGGFFRPNAHGYTTDITQAGVFEKEEAERYLDVEGLTIHPLTEFREKINDELASLSARLAKLRVWSSQLSQ